MILTLKYFYQQFLISYRYQLSYLILDMQAQESYQLNSPLYDASAFIPANYNYFNFNLSSQYISQIPQGLYIVPFQTHEITFRQLLSQLLESLGLSKKLFLDKIKISLKSGYVIKQKTTAQELRIKLCRQSASGITLEAKLMDNISNQAAITFHIKNDPDFNNNYINKWFLLINNQQPFSISIQKSIKFKELQGQICQCLNQQYKNGVAPENLTFYKIKKIQVQIAFSWEKVSKLQGDQVTKNIVKEQLQIIGVQVTKENAKWPYSQVVSEEYLIFHIQKDNKIKLRFSMIDKYTVGELLNSLQIKHSDKLGIKIVDEIFAPCKLIKEASKYFQTGEGKYVKNVECRLVSEKEMFYKSMKQIQGNFEIGKKMVTKTKEEHFQKCEDLARRVSWQFEQANKQHFTDYKEISPITLYTSSVQVIDKKGSKLLYRSINDYLREKLFGLSEDHKQEWKYKYSATLINSLEKIQPFCVIKQMEKIVVYRGVSGHQMKGQEGQIYVAKQFLSTSTNKERARKFIKGSPMGTFLQVQCLTGKNIKQFSIYPQQDEILFKPFTYFRIVKKDTSKPIYQMKLVELPSKPIQSNPATIILWVDDKKKEGQKVITSLDCPMHTTFLHQLCSTRQLSQWIDKNQQLVNNPFVKKVLITNMKRKEDQIDVLDAGAHSYKLVRQRIKDFQAIFYIGHIEGTKNALIKNGINPQEVKIYNKRLELRNFIASVCVPMEQKEKQEVIQQVNSSILKFFDPIQQTNKSQSSKSTI